MLIAVLPSITVQRKLERVHCVVADHHSNKCYITGRWHTVFDGVHTHILRVHVLGVDCRLRITIVPLRTAALSKRLRFDVALHCDSRRMHTRVC